MLIGTLGIMNGTPNLIQLKYRSWHSEEEDLPEEEEQQDDILEGTDENQLRKWCVL